MTFLRCLRKGAMEEDPGNGIEKGKKAEENRNHLSFAKKWNNTERLNYFAQRPIPGRSGSDFYRLEMQRSQIHLRFPFTTDFITQETSQCVRQTFPIGAVV